MEGPTPGGSRRAEGLCGAPHTAPPTRSVPAPRRTGDKFTRARGATMSKVWEGVFSAIYDPLLWVGERAGMAQRRAELLRQAKGQVLELGAGTGLNLPHYPDRLEELVLTEPSPPMVARLERRAKRSGTPSSVVAAEAERLPFEDDRFDTVVSTLVLCTVDEPQPGDRRDRQGPPAGRQAALSRARAVGLAAPGPLAGPSAPAVACVRRRLQRESGDRRPAPRQRAPGRDRRTRPLELDARARPPAGDRNRRGLAGRPRPRLMAKPSRR